VNLIAPDGTLSAQATVETGVQTVRILVLSVEADLNSYSHYTPGTHRLVGLSADGQEAGSLEFQMRPDLRVRQVQQYQQGDRGSDFGRLLFAIENVGTAPTWVYDITYREAPAQAANDPLSETPGIPRIDSVPDSAGLVILPGEERSYLNSRAPLVFTGTSSSSCNGVESFVAVVGIATGAVIETRIEATVRGEVVPAGLVDSYTCTEVSIEQLDSINSTDRTDSGAAQ
jgi:hypothetical protein